MKLNDKLINSHVRPISFEIYSFIGLVKTYYELPSNVTDRIINIFTRLDHKYNDYFGGRRYENVILAITIFSVREFQQYFVSTAPSFDVTDYVRCLYGEENVMKNIKEIYYILIIIQAVFGTTMYPIDAGVVLPITK